MMKWRYVSCGRCMSLKASTITLPAVQKLYTGAFQNCSKISRITISSKSLKTVESKAITGINKKAVIRVPASKLTAYKKYLKLQPDM